MPSHQDKQQKREELLKRFPWLAEPLTEAQKVALAKLGR